MPLKPLAPEDVAAARAWLARFDDVAREWADVLAHHKAVSEVEGLGERIGFRGKVEDKSRTFETQVFSERGRVWRGECSCVVGRNCKHNAALLVVALRTLGVPIPRHLPSGNWWRDEKPATLHEENIQAWRKWFAEDRGGPGEPAGSAELRVRIAPEGVTLEWCKPGAAEYAVLRGVPFSRLLDRTERGDNPFEGVSALLWSLFTPSPSRAQPDIPLYDPRCAPVLGVLLRSPEFVDRLVSAEGLPFRRAEERLEWKMKPPGHMGEDYHVALTLPDGSAPPPLLRFLPGRPPLYVAATGYYTAPPTGRLDPAKSTLIPAAALETRDGLAFIRRVGVPLPAALRERVKTVPLRAVLRCWVEPQPFTDRELVCLEARAETGQGQVVEIFDKEEWRPASTSEEPGLVDFDRTALAAVPAYAEAFAGKWFPYEQRWQRVVGVKFPEFFAEWLAAAPPGVEVALEGELASFRESAIAADVRLEVAEAGIDWFDVRIALDVRDVTLTKKELKALLDARGGYVRLGTKGWRRLAFQFSAEDEAQLADLGLNPGEFSGEPQRLHALQLAGKTGAKRLLAQEHVRAIERRAEEIRTRVTPDVPGVIRAELRPYQVEGFHFLAYLSSNSFGGILADDMGLGKTLQALAWIEWLRARPECEKQPVLVVCPKSVTDNWHAEAARFAPHLRVRVLPVGATAKHVDAARTDTDLVVANYAQLRVLEAPLAAAPWLAVILDEAQAIKNPESQTAKIAWKLNAAHRLALSGTPIENRLLDLWSIMQFAMPGVLGNRNAFSKSYDQRGDPLARSRLSARVRPFVLRRTKGEVAKDLPERIEEDLHCTLDGAQLTLYRAELKRARASILQLNTQADLDRSRFHVLTSLLRLRQICCHPALVSEKAANAESAKLVALLDLVEPLIEEGHKVLVFSQFVEMLNLIRADLTAREVPHFILTGETENRGELVQDFQQCEGGAVFLISLRAGGFGLNLTAASYVVLFDPWWNPAVENQAIDRTHRIGQRNTVIAYRLLMKNTIEEKIRALQMQKRALAADILGEENFARTLTLNDFRFLLSGEDDED